MTAQATKTKPQVPQNSIDLMKQIFGAALVVAPKMQPKNMSVVEAFLDVRDTLWERDKAVPTGMPLVIHAIFIEGDDVRVYAFPTTGAPDGLGFTRYVLSRTAMSALREGMTLECYEAEMKLEFVKLWIASAANEDEEVCERCGQELPTEPGEEPTEDPEDPEPEGGETGETGEPATDA